MAHGLTPIRLAALHAPAVVPPLAPAYEPRLFPVAEFIEMTIDRVVDDHVVARHGGKTTSYAIGHLSQEARRLLSPSREVGAKLANAPKRTILGIVSDQVIEDLRDETPAACPLAVSAIRLYSNDPARALREYAAHAVVLGDVVGKEFGIGGASIVYRGSGRRLTVEIAAEGWMLETDSLLIPHVLPQTICAGARGRRLSQIVEHRMLEGVDAVVTGAEVTGMATQIAFRTEAVAVKGLPELRGRSA